MMRMHNLVLSLVLCCTAVASAAPAASTPPEPEWVRQLPPAAREHMRAGLAKFKSQSYNEAFDEFKAAYDIERHTQILFSMGQARRLAGDCQAAVAIFNDYLRERINQRQADVAHQAIEQCKSQMPPSPPPPASPPPHATPSTPHVTPAVPPPTTAPSTTETSPGANLTRAAPAPSDRRPWYGDAAGISTLVVGVALVAAGGGLIAVGNSKMSDASNLMHAPTLEEHDQQGDIAQKWQYAGTATLCVGGALAAFGLIHWSVYLARRERPQRVAFAPVVGPRFNGASLSLTF